MIPNIVVKHVFLFLSVVYKNRILLRNPQEQCHCVFPHTCIVGTVNPRSKNVEQT